MASEIPSGKDLPSDEQATQELVRQLMASRNLLPLIAQLRDGEIGPACARDALRVLGELDLDLLVQITLDELTTSYPASARQARPAVRGE